ncbi:methyltransferase domain-containing protein [candidate division KSB1 bacterium]|nr:methyltransferase domain-containing protein [candidate division KSB1 bacterium]
MKNSGNILQQVNQFYEDHPFPGFDIRRYSYSEDLRRQASWFGRFLDAQIPFHCRVLDAGCGTGQLANFLALKQRQVLGIDYSAQSIAKADALRERLQIKSATFRRANILEPIPESAEFDYVLSLGVLHHTSDPYKGFQNLVHAAKNGGYLVIGLYNPFGRIPVKMRRLLRRMFRTSGIEKKAVQRQLVTGHEDFEKNESWLADQYYHPHESTHSIGEVLNWFDKNGIEYINAMPPIEIFRSMKNNHRAFSKPAVATWRHGFISQFLVQLKWILSLRDNGGYFTIIGRKL